MACCILAAMLMSQLYAVWNMRRRLAIIVPLIALSAGTLAWLVSEAYPHIAHFSAHLVAAPAEAAPALRPEADAGDAPLCGAGRADDRLGLQKIPHYHR